MDDIAIRAARRELNEKSRLIDQQLRALPRTTQEVAEIEQALKEGEQARKDKKEKDEQAYDTHIITLGWGLSTMYMLFSVAFAIIAVFVRFAPATHDNSECFSGSGFSYSKNACDAWICGFISIFLLICAIMAPLSTKLIVDKRISKRRQIQVQPQSNDTVAVPSVPTYTDEQMKQLAEVLVA
jgi:hypothetical protein